MGGRGRAGVGALRFAAAVAALATVGCGDKLDPRARATCEQAATRYEACIKELLGPALAAQASAKRDIGACARDARTVAMYETCLPAKSCDELMACMMGEAEKGP